MSDQKSTDTNQIFELATGLDTLAIGVSPAQSFAVLDAVMVQTLGMAMYNAVSAQQNAATVRSAAVTMACAGILSLPVAALDKHPAGAGQSGPGRPAAASARETPSVSGTAAPDRSTGRAESASPERADSRVNPQIIDAIAQVQEAVMAHQVVLTSGAGKAYQLVAQSAAIAVQDATDALRAVSIIAATGSGVAMTRFLATGDAKYLLGITAAQDTVKVATEDFARISAAATEALKNFPSG